MRNLNFSSKRWGSMITCGDLVCHVHPEKSGGGRYFTVMCAQCVLCSISLHLFSCFCFFVSIVFLFCFSAWAWAVSGRDMDCWTVMWMYVYVGYWMNSGSTRVREVLLFLLFCCGSFLCTVWLQKKTLQKTSKNKDWWQRQKLDNNWITREWIRNQRTLLPCQHHNLRA